MKKRISLKEVKQAEAEYANAIARWGEHNLVTQRAMIKWDELKKRYIEERR